MRKPEENNELGKYEQEFARLMQEAVAKHREDDMDLNIDYSFLDDYERVVIDTAKKRHFKKSLVRVAVILLVFFTGISVAMVTDVTTDASAWKAQVAKRLYVLKEGYISTDSNVSLNYTDERTMTVTIDDFDKISKARNLAPQLQTLGYIPDGYDFDILKIDIMYNKSYTAIYNFSGNDDKYFSLSIYYNPDIEHTTLNIDNVIEKIELEERDIYIWYDSIEDIHGSTVVAEDCTTVILGDIDKEEMLKVADELK